MIGRYKGQKKKWGREERRRGKERTRQTSHVLPPQALRPAHPRAEAQRERQRGFERARTAAFFPEERDVDAGTAREGRGGGVRKVRDVFPRVKTALPPFPLLPLLLRATSLAILLEPSFPVFPLLGRLLPYHISNPYSSLPQPLYPYPSSSPSFNVPSPSHFPSPFP